MKKSLDFFFLKNYIHHQMKPKFNKKPHQGAETMNIQLHDIKDIVNKSKRGGG